MKTTKKYCTPISEVVNLNFNRDTMQNIDDGDTSEQLVNQQQLDLGFEEEHLNDSFTRNIKPSLWD